MSITPFSKQEPDKPKLKKAWGGMAVEAGANNAPARRRFFSPGVPDAEDDVFTLE